jgi:hypothetical protein
MNDAPRAARANRLGLVGSLAPRVPRILAALVALAASVCASCDRRGSSRGAVSLAWSLTGPDHQPIACDRVGATAVSLTARDRARGFTAITSVPCTASPSAQPLAAGVYDVAIALRTADGTLLATSPGQTAIVASGQLTLLAPAIFELGARLVLSFSAESAARNCAPLEDGGAGITRATVVLAHTGDGCAPVTFVRTRGDTEVERYRVSCRAPHVTSCIESDETLTVADIAPGRYTISVRGKIGALDCWESTEVIDVDWGLPTKRALELTQRRADGCPPHRHTPRARQSGGVP